MNFLNYMIDFTAPNNAHTSVRGGPAAAAMAVLHPVGTVAFDGWTYGVKQAEGKWLSVENGQAQLDNIERAALRREKAKAVRAASLGADFALESRAGFVQSFT